MSRVVAVVVLSLIAVQNRQTVPAPGAIQAALDEWRASIQSPGASLGIVTEDGTVTALVSGVSNRAAATPMKTGDLLMAGSVGKTFFAALALRLIEQGRLNLNAPISTYLGTKPWFSRLPNAKDITVRMLMTHTSGLVRYEMNPKFTADLRAQPDKSWTPEEEIAYLLDSTPPFAAGQGWDYSDTNYIVLGQEDSACAKACRDFNRSLIRVHNQNLGGTHQLGSQSGTKSDGSLGEHCDNVPQADLPLSAAANPVEAISASSRTCSSERLSGMTARLAWACGTLTYSACAPSIVLPKRQPPRASNPSPWPHWLRLPDRHARHWPHGVIAPTSTRWPIS
jgi:hypothetical protein